MALFTIHYSLFIIHYSLFTIHSSQHFIHLNVGFIQRASFCLVVFEERRIFAPPNKNNMTMKKKIILFALAVILALCGWYYYSTQISNPWNADTIGDIAAPLGYTRVEAPQGSYAAYLRSLPLKERGAKVHLFTGETAGFQFLSTGVIDQDILSNSEQCADAAMRLRAEYLWSQGRYSEIRFRNVNGQTMQYSGGSSRKAFERYMREVYGVCSTFSVYHETKPRAVKDVQPGDVLVYPARSGHKYGHAIIVVDVAKDKSGNVAIMCAEGNTPAREKHLVRNPNPLNNPWFFLDDDDDAFIISCFYFNKDELRHY